LTFLLALASSAAAVTAPAVEILNATGGLPAHIVSQFTDPIGFAEASTGEAIVLDRRAHTVYIVDAAKRGARKLFQIGFEKGELLGPGVLSLAGNDIFAVADAPGGRERIQYFSLKGSFLGGFYLDSTAEPRLVVGSLVLSGVGSLHFTGQTFLLNQPASGAVISELDNRGGVVRRIGTLRKTGHESDRDLHLALNLGLPLSDPAGGYVFVFQTGVPMFRKYDAAGTLVFERHIEGVEVDADIQTLPSIWPRRPAASGRLPIVQPLVNAAAVDAAGHVWISLAAGVTYVYDPRGDKVRTIRFTAAGPLSPTSLVFAPGQRVLVTPGCYEFRTAPARSTPPVR
jgi:hypothetical protein